MKLTQQNVNNKLCQKLANNKAGESVSSRAVFACGVLSGDRTRFTKSASLHAYSRYDQH